jgi:hypothetical protein
MAFIRQQASLAEYKKPTLLAGQLQIEDLPRKLEITIYIIQ